MTNLFALDGSFFGQDSLLRKIYIGFSSRNKATNIEILVMNSENEKIFHLTGFIVAEVKRNFYAFDSLKICSEVFSVEANENQFYFNQEKDLVSFQINILSLEKIDFKKDHHFNFQLSIKNHFRAENIRNFSALKKEAVAYYPESNEKFSLGSPFSRFFEIQNFGVHHELLPPGRRSSWPHAEGSEDEFIYVLEGYPDLWQNGELIRLFPGDGVGYPCGTGFSHTFINNTDDPVKLLVVGETSKKDGKVFYPFSPTRKKYLQSRWWSEVPKVEYGRHCGLSNSQITMVQQPMIFQAEIDISLFENLEAFEFVLALGSWVALKNSEQKLCSLEQTVLEENLDYFCKNLKFESKLVWHSLDSKTFYKFENKKYFLLNQ